MKVLMLGWEFPPYMSGGLGTACYNLTKNMSKLGTHIVFVIPQLKSHKKIAIAERLDITGVSGAVIPESRMQAITLAAQEAWGKNLNIHPVDSSLRPYETDEEYRHSLEGINNRQSADYYKKSGTNVIELSGSYGQNLFDEVYRYAFAVAESVKDEHFDLIHAHDWMTYPAGMLLKKLTNKPLVVHAHALEIDRSGFHKNHDVAHLEWAGMNAADQVIAVSNYTKSAIMEEYGIPAEKISVAHNAVPKDTAFHNYKIPPLLHDEKRVLFMGRVTFQKGPDYFVEAAKLVLDAMTNVRFIMTGSGDMLTRMIRRVAELRMGQHFNFTGFLKGDDVDRMYAMSDLYVMPSVTEPFGITPLEAMMHDVPVIIAKQSGVREVLPRALCVDFWDVKEMANKICSVLAYPALSDAIVSHCQEELQHIRWENTARIVQDIYRKVLRR